MNKERGQQRAPATFISSTPMGWRDSAAAATTAWRGATCRELLNVAVDVCGSSIIGEFDSQEEPLGYAEQAAEASRSATYMQIAGFTLLAATMIYTYGRFLAWFFLSLVLLVIQIAYIGYTSLAIALNIMVYSWLTYFAFLYYFYESVHRWGKAARSGGGGRSGGGCGGRPRGPSIARSAGTSTPSTARTRGAQTPPATRRRACALRRAAAAGAEAGEAEEVVGLLRTMMQRKHLGVDHAALFSECRVGTKADVEGFVTEQVKALRWLRGCGAAGVAAARTALGLGSAMTPPPPPCRRPRHPRRPHRRRASRPTRASSFSSARPSASATPALPLGRRRAVHVPHGCGQGPAGERRDAGDRLGHVGRRDRLRRPRHPHRRRDAPRHHPTRHRDRALPGAVVPPLEQQLYSYLKTGVLVQHDAFAALRRVLRRLHLPGGLRAHRPRRQYQRLPGARGAGGRCARRAAPQPPDVAACWSARRCTRRARCRR